MMNEIKACVWSLCALFLSVSCAPEAKEPVGVTISTDTHAVKKVDTSTATKRSDSTNANKIAPLTPWKSLADIQHHWTMLERDAKGYLVYNPCNGDTPEILIENNRVIIYWQLDEPSRFSIDKFTRTSGNKGFFILAQDSSKRTVKCEVSIADAGRALALWSIKTYSNEEEIDGNFSWVMTPSENRKQFRQVDNPCPDQMKPEKEFLPVEH